MEANQEAKIKVLLQKSVNISAVNWNGKKALDFARKKKNDGIFHLLLNEELIFASKNGDVDLVKDLLKNGRLYMKKYKKDNEKKFNDLIKNHPRDYIKEKLVFDFVHFNLYT